MATYDAENPTCSDEKATNYFSVKQKNDVTSGLYDLHYKHQHILMEAKIRMKDVAITKFDFKGFLPLTRKLRKYLTINKITGKSYKSSY